jgi:hypothetical protein
MQLQHIKSFSVFTYGCLVAASNDGHSHSSGFPNSVRPQLPAYHISQLQLSADATQVEVEVTLLPTVSRPVRLGIGPPFGADVQVLNFFEQQLLSFLFIYGALSDERTGP